jgi:hypothetical protein
MKINDRDKSSYLKGLLILAKRDKVLAESEQEIIKNIASRLGFSSDFYEYTLQNLIENEFLTEEPVQFSDQKIAESFIVDGFNLAHSDSHLDQREIDWLRETATENKIDFEWFNNKLEEFKSKPDHSPLTGLAPHSII